MNNHKRQVNTAIALTRITNPSERENYGVFRN